MENFFESVLTILEQFIRPQTTIHEFLNSTDPVIASFLPPVVMGIGVLFVIGGAVLWVMSETEVSGTVLALLGVLAVLGLAGIVCSGQTLGITQLFLRGYSVIGLLLAQPPLALGAFGVGFLGGRYPFFLLVAFVFAVFLAALVDQVGVGLLVAALLVILTAGEAARLLWRVGLEQPLMLIGLFLVVLIAGMQDVEIISWYTRDILSSTDGFVGSLLRTVWLVIIPLLFPVALGIGLATGLLARFQE